MNIKTSSPTSSSGLKLFYKNQESKIHFAIAIILATGMGLGFGYGFGLSEGLLASGLTAVALLGIFLCVSHRKSSLAKSQREKLTPTSTISQNQDLRIKKELHFQYIDQNGHSTDYTRSLIEKDNDLSFRNLLILSTGDKAGAEKPWEDLDITMNGVPIEASLLNRPVREFPFVPMSTKGAIPQIHIIIREKAKITPGGVSSQPDLGASSSSSPSSVSLAASSSSAAASEVSASKIDTHGGLVYGPEAWAIWNVEVLDQEIPERPKVDLSKGDKILLYIPQSIKVNGKEKKLTLNVLKEISGDLCDIRGELTREHFLDKTFSGGWIHIDKYVIPETREKKFEEQRKMIEERGYSLPSLLEAVAVNLMVFKFTGERLYGKDPRTCVQCLESLEDFHIIVGDFGSKCVEVFPYYNFPARWLGAVGVQRSFKN